MTTAEMQKRISDYIFNNPEFDKYIHDVISDYTSKTLHANLHSKSPHETLDRFLSFDTNYSSSFYSANEQIEYVKNILSAKSDILIRWLSYADEIPKYKKDTEASLNVPGTCYLEKSNANGAGKLIFDINLPSEGYDQPSGFGYKIDNKSHSIKEYYPHDITIVLVINDNYDSRCDFDSMMRFLETDENGNYKHKNCCPFQIMTAYPNIKKSEMIHDTDMSIIMKQTTTFQNANDFEKKYLEYMCNEKNTFKTYFNSEKQYVNFSLPEGNKCNVYDDCFIKIYNAKTKTTKKAKGEENFEQLFKDSGISTDVIEQLKSSILDIKSKTIDSSIYKPKTGRDKKLEVFNDLGIDIEDEEIYIDSEYT